MLAGVTRFYIITNPSRAVKLPDLKVGQARTWTVDLLALVLFQEKTTIVKRLESGSSTVGSDCIRGVHMNQDIVS